MNPEVAALLEELADDTRKASVTFFPMGIHTHLTSDGRGGWNLEVHSTVEDHETQQEEIISAEQSLSTEELVGRMGILAMIAEGYMSQAVADLTADLDAELNALLNGE